MKRVFSVLGVLFPFLVYCQTKTTGGKVTNEENEPLSGATITLKGTERRVVTDHRGAFSFSQASERDTLVVSSVGYQTMEVPIGGREQLTITLTRKVGVLDEAVVIAYGTTTRRLATGSVGRVGAAELKKQPLGNVLAALGGRVPGLVVSQSSGVPGSGVKVQLRGIHSLVQGSEPLFLVDGVPFAPGNGAVSSLTSAIGGLNAFGLLNPDDIQSIEVLKDADATAIYGSRGANGVVLITTRRGVGGATRVEGSLQHGWSEAPQAVQMLRTPEYLALRREAFQNDGTVPTAATAPDLLVWDTGRYTDLRRLLLGTARTVNGGAALSGGTAATNFRLSAQYRDEETVFRGGGEARRGSVQLALQHRTPGERLRADVSASYTTGLNRVPTTDMSSWMTLPPNLPPLYDASGALKWEEGGVSYTNPLAYRLRTYEAGTGNLLASASLALQLARGLSLKFSGGYNRLMVDETTLTPRAAINPALSTQASARYGSNSMSSRSLEPQLTYHRAIGKGKLELLAGATGQRQQGRSSVLSASGFSSDALLHNRSAAASVTVNNYTDADYRYSALFGRAAYNWRGTYLLNLTGRRDGSSRFGPGRQWGSFGAVGGAWIFSNEAFVRKGLPFVSFGKLRGSFGTSGNDQLADYAYLNTWSATSYTYGGVAGLYPARLFNPELAWEAVRKLEGALELGFWKDRLLVSAAWYRHRSANQLAAYPLPVQTGFTSVQQNLPALVENSGWEGTLEAEVVQREGLSWTLRANITAARNRLLRFPGLDASSYAGKYLVGRPISLVNNYRYLGVDPATGTLAFEDVDKDGKVSGRADYVYGGSLLPAFYGGAGTALRYKGFGLEVFVEGRRQRGWSYRAALANLPPGIMVNQPVEVLARWQRAGEAAALPAFTASSSSAVYRSWSSLGSSSGAYEDASFLRLKNVHLSWQVPPGWSGRLHGEAVRLYVQGQNLYTLTPYEAGDPETQSLYTLPPLRTLTAGISFTLK